MSPLDIDTALEWRGRTVVDRDGEKIGTLKEIYLDEDDRPSWGSVATGLFGTRETLVPLDAAEEHEDGLRLPFAGDHVKDAPNVDPDVQLSPEDEERLAGHYDRGGEAPPAAAARAPDDDATARDDDNGDDAARDDDAMIRSEEEISVRKEERPRERVKLKKYVVTDYVKKTVPVQREEVRLEHDPPESAPPGDR